VSSSSLGEDHIVFVIEDAVAEVEGSWTDDRGALPDPALSRVVLYGWATGALTAGDIALRSSSDVGARYLLRGASTSFREVRAFREARYAELRSLYSEVFEVLALAGARRLGRIALPMASGRDRRQLDELAMACDELAREWLDEAQAADEDDDQDLAEFPDRDYPGSLASRKTRRLAFATSRAARASVSGRFGRPAGPTTFNALELSAGRDARRGIRAPSAARLPRSRTRIVGAAASAAVLFVGLALLRWVSTSVPVANGEPRVVARQPTPMGAQPTIAEPSRVIPPTDTLRTAAAATELADARDEAMGLAAQSLASDDLQAARDFYFLAVQSVPSDPEARDRLRQVETALSVDQPRLNWDDTLSDLQELRDAAPASPAVLQAYVTALVGAGRAALLSGDRDRGVGYCGEAVRWLPGRDDTQGCLRLANGETATATPTPSSTATPSPTASPTLSALIQQTPQPGDVPTAGGAAPPLEVVFSGACQPAPGRPNAAGLIRLNGVVSSADGPVPNYRLIATAKSPSGQATVVANATYLTPIFQIQQAVPDSGPYSVTVTVAKDGYTAGQSSVDVTC